MPRNTWATASAALVGSRLVRWKLDGGLVQVEPRAATIRAHHFIERHVGGELVAEPALEHPDAFRSHRLLFVAQQVGPLECPEIGELGAIEQAVDQLRSFQGVAIGQESSGLAGRR